MTRILLTLALMLGINCAYGQDFVNLSQRELSIDSMLPTYSFIQNIGRDYADKDYNVTLEYPEFAVMTKDEIARYKKIVGNVKPGEMPEINTYVGVERKVGQLNVSFVPIVFRDHKYMKLVSFKPVVEEVIKPQTRMAKTATTERYAKHSVLAQGKWVKIRVPSTGFYAITAEAAKKVGFNDISKVKVYGYGGALQPEVLDGNYLSETDDLKEIPTYQNGNRKMFFAQGPVSWSSPTVTTRTLNTYSLYGYYFLTEGDEPMTMNFDDFTKKYYPSNGDYHALYEKDEFSWYHGGRNFYESSPITSSGKTYSLSTAGHCANGQLAVTVTADATANVSVEFNGTSVGTVSVSKPVAYAKANVGTRVFTVDNIAESNSIKLVTGSSATVRLDNITLTFKEPTPMVDLNGSGVKEPEYVAHIDNQDLHADSVYQMVIIVPESEKVKSQAMRLKELHEKEGMRVKVVPSYELYHEFSSGTPDANAYRRYMKMLYDKNEGDNMPRYLLLFGDCAWDNRMIINDWKQSKPEDYLLCYESDNSFSETVCYILEDYFGFLDDGEGANHKTTKPDLGIGRMTALTEDEAKIMVDKIIDYAENVNAGDWQNVICMIGDDANNNMHMDDAEAVAQMIETNHPGYNVKRYYTDAYTLEKTSTGNAYPEVTKELRNQMKNGALLMNYTGHGKADQISHEKILTLSDFKTNTTTALPMWVTASCDIMPIDSKSENIGEAAMSNSKGGAVAFLGTTRTVYANYNRKINMFYTKYVLDSTDGRQNTIGDALRLAKNSLVDDKSQQDISENKLHFVLLGDPAMRLACPAQQVMIESINGKPVGNDIFKMPAGSTADISGYILMNGKVDTTFNGKIMGTVKDAIETIVCHDWDGCGKQFEYQDYTSTIYNGSDSVKNGRFTFRIAIPLDISYSDQTGKMTLYAVSSDKKSTANGTFDKYVLNGSEIESNDSIGPSIYCYLNSPSFVDGGNVNTTPFFYAEINDKNGVNTSSSGIGHDMVLIIDGDMYQTYNLNDYFQYDFGTYTSGNLSYVLPELTEGPHSLVFRAWDMQNNSSITKLTFNVVKGLDSKIYDIYATENPARYNTQFVLLYDRPGTPVDITFEVYDILGRLIWRKTENNVYTNGTYYMTWDLQSNNRQDVGTGVYLYRARIACDGGSETLKAKKLIVVRQ